MNAKYFLPVAAVFLAACSDVTAPTNNLNVSAGRQTTPPAPPPGPVETFETGISSLGVFNISTLTTSPGTTKKPATAFLGRLLNDELSISVAGGQSSVTISFDLYIIGTWDGAGYQGFGGDWWQIEVSKSGGARENVFHTSFSNQATKPQHFPKQVTAGTSPADKGAAYVNVLGYPKASGKFDAGDAIYHLTYTVSNPSAGPVVFYLHSTTGLQDLNDESWGIDNVSISN